MDEYPFMLVSSKVEIKLTNMLESNIYFNPQNLPEKLFNDYFYALKRKQNIYFYNNFNQWTMKTVIG